jgi:hypothetical protein
MSDIAWLRNLAEKGSKGIVDNIDARALGRIANEIERLHTDRAELLSALKRCEAMVSSDQGPPNWDWIREVIAKVESRK